MFERMFSIITPGSVEKIFSITVGQYTVPKSSVTSRGYSQFVAMGSIVDSSFIGETVYQIYATTDGAGGHTFTASMSGSYAGVAMSAVPQNYGGTLPPVAGVLGGGGTIWTWTLPNANLFINWASGTSRTCQLIFG